MNSEADGFAIGEDDDRMTVDGSTSEALVAESKVFPAPSTKQFNIQDEHGVTKIRVRLPVYVDSIIDTPVKATVQVRLRDGRFVSETAVCK